MCVVCRHFPQQRVAAAAASEKVSATRKATIVAWLQLACGWSIVAAKVRRLVERVAVLIALAPAAVLQFCLIRLCCLPAEGPCRAASRQQQHAPTALLYADLCVVCVVRVCLQGQGHTASDAQSTWRNHTLALFIKAVKKKSALVKAVKAEFLLTPAATAGQQWKDPREGEWPFERERG